MTEKLCAALQDIADSGGVARVDELFAQLTIAIICETAFNLDMSVFEGIDNDCSNYGRILREVFKHSWIGMVPCSFLLYHLPFYPFNRYKAA